MILDKWENRGCYLTAHPLFAEAFAYIEDYLNNPVEPGIYEISGQDLFAKVQCYQTREEGLYEAHDVYIDVQFMVSGIEQVFYRQRDGLVEQGSYDEKEDAWFFNDATDNEIQYYLKPNDFTIFFPQDAHKPAMSVGEPNEAEKIVIKVRL